MLKQINNKYRLTSMEEPTDEMLQALIAGARQRLLFSY